MNASRFTVARKGNKMELFHANKQWSSRPADQRFTSIQELHDQCKAYYRTAKENKVPVSVIRTEAIDGNVQLVGRAGNPAQLTHWSFGQLSQRIGAPRPTCGNSPLRWHVRTLITVWQSFRVTTMQICSSTPTDLYSYARSLPMNTPESGIGKLRSGS